MIAVRSGFASVGLRPLLALLLILAGLLPGTAMAQRTLSNGQHLYLPIYAFIRYGDLDHSGVARQVVLTKLYAVHKNDPDSHLSVSNELRDQFARTLREDEAALEAKAGNAGEKSI